MKSAKTRHLRTRFLLAGLVALSVDVASADEVILTNGDHLTGSIVHKEDDRLVFQTTYGGDLRIRWFEVTGISSDKPQRIFLYDGRRLIGKPSVNGEGELIVEVDGEPQSEPVSLSRVQWINPSPHVSGEGTHYEGRFNLGAAFTSGNTDTESLHADAQVIARTQKNRYTAGFAVNEGKNLGVKSESNSLGYLKYDRFFTPKWYGYVNGSAERDLFKDIELRTISGAGSGYQFLDTDRTHLSLEGGLSDVRTDFNVAADDDYPALRWALKFEYYLLKTKEHLLKSKLQFFHQHETIVGLEDPRKILVRSITGLRMPIADKFRTELQYNLDWENDPAPGRLRTDRAVLLTVGYAF